MESFEIEVLLPVAAEVVYEAYLDSEIHSDFTGAMAAIEARTNTFFTAWDGYITGKILKLEENRRILQSWRTTEFPLEAESSLVDIILEERGDECLLKLIHSEIPQGQGKNYKEGWDEHYFQPMKKYFAAK